jgi:membrane-associated phospholipid phosphatase
MYELSAAGAAQSSPDAILAWGLEVIHSSQAWGNPAITDIAKLITKIGGPLPYLAIVAAIFWCVDERHGFKLGIALFLSNGINLSIKNALQVPRPFTVDPAVQLTPIHDPWSTPSGHSQNTAAFWPTLLLGWKKGARAFAPRLALALAIPLLVGLSRVYLGVHYPTDVAFGWALGALVSVSLVFIAPTLKSRYESCGGAIAKLRDYFARARAASGRSLRSLKLASAAIVALILNATSHGDSSMGGALFGFAAGYILLTDRDEGAAARFSAASGSIAQKAIRFALGLAGFFLLYIALKRFLPGAQSPHYELCRFLRYGILGFYLSALAPMAFLRIKLAGGEKR